MRIIDDVMYRGIKSLFTEDDYLTGQIFIPLIPLCNVH